MKTSGRSMHRLALSALCALALLAGCGGPLRYTVQGADKATGADVNIVADVDEGAAMTRLTIKAENLPPPDRIQGGGTTFVVWARKDGDAPWQRIGALQYDADDRVGELPEASVPLTAFELMITAEQKADAASPAPAVIASQLVQD